MTLHQVREVLRQFHLTEDQVGRLAPLVKTWAWMRGIDDGQAVVSIMGAHTGSPRARRRIIEQTELDLFVPFDELIAKLTDSLPPMTWHEHSPGLLEVLAGEISAFIDRRQRREDPPMDVRGGRKLAEERTFPDPEDPPMEMIKRP